MAVDVIDITEAQADHLAFLEEGHFLDLKSIEIEPGKLTRSMSAFGNSDGGELLIGIAEHKPTATTTWRGFLTQEDANGHLQAFEDQFPLGGDFRYEFLRAPNRLGLVLHATILKTTDIKVAANGKTYVRRGAQNLPVAEGPGMDQLRRTKGVTSHESQTLAAADVQDIAKAMKKLQLRDPEIVEGDQSVLVLIRHERLASPEKMILEHVDANGSINNPKARALTGIESEYKVRRILKRLTETGELEQTGRTTATSYVRPADGSSRPATSEAALRPIDGGVE
jgi:predicted HTH transcriptional regulator